MKCDKFVCQCQAVYSPVGIGSVTSMALFARISCYYQVVEHKVCIVSVKCKIVKNCQYVFLFLVTDRVGCSVEHK